MQSMGGAICTKKKRKRKLHNYTVIVMYVLFMQQYLKKKVSVVYRSRSGWVVSRRLGWSLLGVVCVKPLLFFSCGIVVPDQLSHIEWGLYLYVVANDSQTLGHNEYNSAPNSKLYFKLYILLHIQVVLHIISTEERISTKDGPSRGKWRYSSAVCNLCYTQQATEYNMQALRCIFLGVPWTVEGLGMMLTLCYTVLMC